MINLLKRGRECCGLVVLIIWAWILRGSLEFDSSASNKSMILEILECNKIFIFFGEWNATNYKCVQNKKISFILVACIMDG